MPNEWTLWEDARQILGVSRDKMTKPSRPKAYHKHERKISVEFGNEDMSITLFEQQPVRRALHEGRWFYSVIDTVAVLMPTSSNPGRYWSDMKRRLHDDEGFVEVYAKCVKLRFAAPDGRMRETDCADMETLLRIIQSIPSPKAEPFKRWLAQVGADVIDDRTEDERRIEYGAEAATAKRRLHDEVHGRGIRTPKAHAELEGRGHKKLYGGETPQGERTRKDIPDDDELSEWRGSEETTANSFRDAQSRAYIKRLEVLGKEPVIQAHEAVSQEVRDTIIRLGNTPPEALPTPKKSLTQVAKDEERRRTKGMDLWGEVDAADAPPPIDAPQDGSDN